ncbi:adenine-specific DNA-methyltransferase [Clostridium sp. USBA 49]|uniref:DNA adenine methylase n=1 Tax=Clostridium sp. USBA 49 TaxID=1881060 RepID=UPI0009997C07|nr:DNA adenine methylase [Clostridium sp. USBA 49]SKA92847.1 adenine-specific DNA-methyltransferase [Clostridium sp. USBA 49]
MSTTYQTKDILEHFGISRQTLYNWINSNLITRPNTDWRGWRIWEEQHIDEISDIIERNKEKNNEANLNRKTTNKIFHIHNRRYLGSKHKLIPFIKKVIKNECEPYTTFADIFGGTGVVADAFNTANTKVIVNDILYSNYISYHTFFSNESYDKTKIKNFINELNNIRPENDNYFSINFGDTYFSYKNALKIGEIREKIEQWSDNDIINHREKSILITSLLYAMDKVANTCGHYDAFRKTIDSGATPIKLLLPSIKDNCNKDNEFYREDANLLVRKIKADIIYIDTPYNSRQYSDSYHLLENVARWEKPEVTGVARKMVDRSDIKSAYCTKKAPLVFKDLIDNCDCKYIIVSYNNMAQKGNGRSNAKISDDEIIETLQSKGTVKIFNTDYKYFTTGKATIEEHKERLFLCKVN